jgi:hypothetical protein
MIEKDVKSQMDLSDNCVQSDMIIRENTLTEPKQTQLSKEPNFAGMELDRSLYPVR